MSSSSLRSPLWLSIAALFLSAAACGRKGQEAAPTSPSGEGPTPCMKPNTCGTTSSGGLLPSNFMLACLSDVADGGYDIDASFEQADMSSVFIFKELRFSGPLPATEPMSSHWTLEQAPDQTYVVVARHASFTFAMALPDNRTDNKTGQKFSASLLMEGHKFNPPQQDAWPVTCSFTAP